MILFLIFIIIILHLFTFTENFYIPNQKPVEIVQRMTDHLTNMKPYAINGNDDVPISLLVNIDTLSLKKMKGVESMFKKVHPPKQVENFSNLPYLNKLSQIKDLLGEKKIIDRKEKENKIYLNLGQSGGNISSLKNQLIELSNYNIS